MKVLCIAASQVTNRGPNSYSYKISEIVKTKIREISNEYVVEISHLANKKLLPCNMCLSCQDSNLCIMDDDFNSLYQQMCNADVIFFICPHYAGIPSKLVIILEKLQEIFYIQGCKNKIETWKLKNKKLGLIVHGGSPKEHVNLYENTLLKPLASICKAIGLKPIDSENYNSGIIFGVKGYKKNENCIVPDMVYDWDLVNNKIEHYISKVFKKATEY